MKRKFVKLKLKFVFKLKLNIEIGFLIQIVRHEICAHKNVIRYDRESYVKMKSNTNADIVTVIHI